MEPIPIVKELLAMSEIATFANMAVVTVGVSPVLIVALAIVSLTIVVLEIVTAVAPP